MSDKRDVEIAKMQENTKRFRIIVNVVGRSVALNMLLGQINELIANWPGGFFFSSEELDLDFDPVAVEEIEDE